MSTSLFCREFFIAHFLHANGPILDDLLLLVYVADLPKLGSTPKPI